ncbi:MAG: SOS response-associated peptidase family protein [Burkholderiales bacterium]|nr:SOS response-associated peptidase family protein [Burkholderiales bacterium]
MCYSAQIIDAWEDFVRRTGAAISLPDFAELYGFRLADRSIRIPKAVDAAFARPADETGRAIQADIDAFDRDQATAWEQALFAQRRRLADAERALQAKPTKAAAESRRIARTKVDWLLGKLAALRRPTLLPEDSRFFPGWYAPVIVFEHGRKLVKPMRYQCRPAGKPAAFDRRFPGTYNARRDNLEGFWKGLFGVTHGLLPVRCFFENVSRDGANVVLEFRPRADEPMLVACLWSRWRGPEGELLSFAAITDEPPPEVAAAGHDRCIIPIKPEHADGWLRPDPKNLAASYAILDDRQRPYYEHRLAA